MLEGGALHPPALGFGDAGHLQGRLLQVLRPVDPVEAHGHVVAEVFQGVFQRELDRAAHAHHPDEGGSGQDQGQQRPQQAPLAPEGVAQREQQRAGEALHPVDEPVDQPLARCPLADAVVADRLPHRDPRAGEHRQQRRQERHQQPDTHLQGQHGRGHGPTRDVDVDDPGHEADEPPGAQGAQGHRHGQRQETIYANQREVHADQLTAAGADSLHDANLAHLLGQHRRDGVDDQKTAEQEAE